MTLTTEVAKAQVDDIISGKVPPKNPIVERYITTTKETGAEIEILNSNIQNLESQLRSMRNKLPVLIGRQCHAIEEMIYWQNHEPTREAVAAAEDVKD